MNNVNNYLKCIYHNPKPYSTRCETKICSLYKKYYFIDKSTLETYVYILLNIFLPSTVIYDLVEFLSRVYVSCVTLDEWVTPVFSPTTRVCIIDFRCFFSWNCESSNRFFEYLINRAMSAMASIGSDLYKVKHFMFLYNPIIVPGIVIIMCQYGENAARALWIIEFQVQLVFKQFI